MKQHVTFKTLLLWLCYVSIAVAINSLFIFAQREIFSPVNNTSLFALAMLAEIPLAIMTVVLPVALIAMFWKTRRKEAVRPLLATLIYVLAGYACMAMAISVRRSGFRDVAKRGSSLAQAIEQFEQANGRPPAKLDELVPEHLSRIPETGIGVAPEFIYIAGVDESGQRVEDVYHGNAWVLQVFAPSWFTDWRGIVYYPRQNYSAYPLEKKFFEMDGWLVVYRLPAKADSEASES